MHRSYLVNIPSFLNYQIWRFPYRLYDRVMLTGLIKIDLIEITVNILDIWKWEGFV